MMKRILIYCAVFLTAFVAKDVCHADLIVQKQVVEVLEGSSGPVTFDIQLQAVGKSYGVRGYNLPLAILNPSVATFASFDPNDAFVYSFSTETLSPSFTADVGVSAAVGGFTVNDGEFFSLATFTLNTTSVPAGQTEVAAFISTGFDANFFAVVNDDGEIPLVNNSGFSIQAVAIPELSSLTFVSFVAIASSIRRRRRCEAKSSNC